MIGFELAARPAVSLLKLDTEQIVCFGAFAVYDTGLAAVLWKLESNNCIGRNGFFESETCA